MFFQQYIPMKIFIFRIDCMEKITGQTIHRKAKRCLVRFADGQSSYFNHLELHAVDVESSITSKKYMYI